jgi:hypothetical protein
LAAVRLGSDLRKAGADRAGFAQRSSGEKRGTSGAAGTAAPDFSAQFVDAARQADRRLRTDVALEDLAVVAGGLDRADHPVLVQPQQLAGVLGRADDAHHDRVLAFLGHLLDVRLRDPELLGFDQAEDDPLGDREPLVVAAAHHRPERLLGDQFGQDHVLLRILGFLVAHRGQSRGIGGVSDTTPGEVGTGRRLHFLEDHGLDVQVVGARIVGQVLLGRRAGLHADGGALQLLGALDLGLDRHHEALPVVVGDAGEAQAQRCVAGQRPGRVAGEDVDLAGLQRGEALLRRQRHPLDLVGVAQHGRRNRAAGVDVEAGPVALAVRRRETGQAGVHAADHRPARLDRVERLAGVRRRGDRRSGNRRAAQQRLH